MQFNSFHFLIFFPIVLILYYLSPAKWRYLILLAASYYFYMSWNVKYVLLLLFSTIVTYGGALLIHRQERRSGKAKLILSATIIANLIILFYFKYANFLFQSVENAFRLLKTYRSFPTIEVLLPVGISFYIFQALGYAIDVYRNDIEPEKDFLRYALFVSYFPQLVAGPIERARNLLPQIQKLEKIQIWDFQRVQRGGLIMLGGFVMKVLIADRAALIANPVFWEPENYPSAMILLAMFLFTIQIYCDFAGYSYIAMGASKMLGIDLMENFHLPFLSRNFKEFWERWHISLSSWFMEYLYIPLGGNRKGKARKYLNLLIVFLVSGLWHGAAWHFVFWGFLHAVYRIVGDFTMPARKRVRIWCGLSDNSLLLRIWQTLFTFTLTSLAFLFFRADTMTHGLRMMHQMFTSRWSVIEMIQAFPARRIEFILLLGMLIILFVIECIREKGYSVISCFERRHWLFRYCFFFLCTMGILVFGVYGPHYDASTFIYFQF